VVLLGAVDVALTRCVGSRLVVQPTQTWIKLYVAVSVPMVFDNVTEIESTVSVLHARMDDAIFDAMTISQPEHMRELYHTLYRLPFLVSGAALCRASCWWRPARVVSSHGRATH
jgi:hypothetical protein